jgi:ATP-binding cassette subfamily B protein
LKDPEIVICDEYTANVDGRTARLVHDALHSQFSGRTRVVITHELAGARGADHIIVLDHGRVAQQGNHEQLRRQPGLYRDLLEIKQITIAKSAGHAFDYDLAPPGAGASPTALT